MLMSDSERFTRTAWVVAPVLCAIVIVVQAVPGCCFGPPPGTQRLFVTNFMGTVLGFADPGTLTGNVQPNTNLGMAPILIIPAMIPPVGHDVLVNGMGELQVLNTFDPSILTFTNASTASGNTAAARTVSGAATQMNTPAAMALDAARNLLYVSNANNNRILVFSNPSQAGFNGNLAPTRNFQTATTGDLNFPLGICVDGGDNLYVANYGANNVLVFASASTRVGDVAASRIITSATFGLIRDVFVDRSNRLYVLREDGFVDTFNNASTLHGPQQPSATVALQVGNPLLYSIVVGNNGTAYISDMNNLAIYSYDNLAGLNGGVAPHRTIQGQATQLTGPTGLFLVE
jgi:hypothetical protein